MRKYIRHYRTQGYKGLIQAVRIRTDRESWLYDSEQTVAEDLVAHNYPDQCLSAVRHYSDAEEGLDITELQFSAGCTVQDAGDALIRNQYAHRERARHIPYYRQIRKHIGNDTLFSCGMSVIIENDRNQVAIARRADSGEWAFPAGAKELEESILDTLHTEVMEELGIEINDPVLLAVISGNDYRVTYPNGHRMHYLSFLFKAGYQGGTLRVNDAENLETAWVDKSELFGIVSEHFVKRQNIYESYSGRVIFN
ncbi:MAG: NUDIX domain-containing protein [Spirochaetales bacterium]|nr:NUDIX domain-containing protein [Spirochaetales bacterium]